MPRFSLLHHSWYNQDIVQEMEHSYSNFFQSTPGSCCRWKWESPLDRCDNCTNTIPVIGTYQMVTWGYGKVDFNLHRSEASPYTFFCPGQCTTQQQVIIPAVTAMPICQNIFNILWAKESKQSSSVFEPTGFGKLMLIQEIADASQETISASVAALRQSGQMLRLSDCQNLQMLR